MNLPMWSISYMECIIMYLVCMISFSVFRWYHILNRSTSGVSSYLASCLLGCTNLDTAFAHIILFVALFEVDNSLLVMCTSNTVPSRGVYSRLYQQSFRYYTFMFVWHA